MRSMRKHRNESGQTLIAAVIVLLIILLAIFLLFDVQNLIRGKVKAQNAVDAAALTGANWQMHTLNLIGELNLVKASTLMISDAALGIAMPPENFTAVKTTVTGVEMFRKLLDQGEAGDNIGCLLRGTKKEEVSRGQVLAKPGSITPHTKFKGEIYVLSKDEGGRHTPFFNNYRPQFYFRTTDVTGTITLAEGTEMVMPGDNTSITVELIAPIAMEKGLRFAIREGGRTVASGRVSEVIE